jgi:hypothetical protein
VNILIHSIMDNQPFDSPSRYNRDSRVLSHPTREYNAHVELVATP